MSTEKVQTSMPLYGLTVVELGHSVAAPFAGQVLADLGAKVIKVENPNGGDDARHWGPPFWHGVSATFQSLNRNKLSVIADIKDPEQFENLRKLMINSDVVLQNMRPGLVERYKLDANSLRAENHKLIYCNLGAFGNAGPLAKSTGYDPLIQAFSGIMSVAGEPERPPVRVGPSIVDQGAGMWSVIGILSALLHRQACGQGCVVDTSLYETALSWMTVPIGNALASGNEPGKSGSETPMLAPYKAYKAKDRYIVIAAGNNNLFMRLSTVLGHVEWVEDSRFRDNKDRVINRKLLNDLIQDVVITRTAQEWSSELALADVPCAPVQNVSEVLGHPQTNALGITPKTPDGLMQLVATPLQFNGKRPSIQSSAPTLGSTALKDVLMSVEKNSMRTPID